MSEENRNGNGRPRFDPTINLGHVLSLSGVIIAIVGGWYSFDTRLKSVETQMARQTQVIELGIRQEERLNYLSDRVLRLEGRK